MLFIGCDGNTDYGAVNFVSNASELHVVITAHHHAHPAGHSFMTELEMQQIIPSLTFFYLTKRALFPAMPQLVHGTGRSPLIPTK